MKFVVVIFLRLFGLPGHFLEFLLSMRKIGFPSGEGIPRVLVSFNLINIFRGFFTRFIVSSNLDWIWPFWIRRQFYADNPDFVARGFQPSSINITYRNWTGIGNLNSKLESVVDPRGLLSPWIEKWSVDVWLIVNDQVISASQLKPEEVIQSLHQNLPIVKTEFAYQKISLSHECAAYPQCNKNKKDDFVSQKIVVTNGSGFTQKIKVAVSFRPYNTEGMTLSYRMNLDGQWVVIDDKAAAYLINKPQKFYVSNLRNGDVAMHIGQPEFEDQTRHSEAGAITSAAVYEFELPSQGQESLEIRYPMIEKFIPFYKKLFEKEKCPTHHELLEKITHEWNNHLNRGLQIQFPEQKFNDLFKANRAYLLLFHDIDEITPGPSTYHHFWFRDSAYMVSALDLMGFHPESRQILMTYPRRQKWSGFFLSQKGEWDSNGEAIWTLWQHYLITKDKQFLKKVYPAMYRGAEWISFKRLSNFKKEEGYRGLMPSGLSAEHFGVDDFYYWDDFWSLAGLRETIAAARLLGKRTHFLLKSYKLLNDALRESFLFIEKKLGKPLLPISPSRRMDSAAVGCLAAYYPLQLYPITEERLQNTLLHMQKHQFIDGSFFHDVNHAGHGTYLALHFAQCFLGLRDTESADQILQFLIERASQTMTWPEAIHPQTKGGCLGDGHHGWMVADLLIFLRNGLFYEDGYRMVFTSYFPKRWMDLKNPIKVEKGPSRFGEINFGIEFIGDHQLTLSLENLWSEAPVDLEWNLPVKIKKAKVDGQEYPCEGQRIHFPVDAKKVEIFY